MEPLVRTARTTGVLYLGVAISGLFSFVIIRPRLFDADNATATLAHLVEQESLARAGVAFELLLVLTEALAAMWFYRLFRSVDPFAAAGIAAFGLVNSAALLGSAAMLGAALEVALSPVGDAATTAQLMHVVSGHVWGAAGLFFGLWLIPMGWCAWRSGWMPRALGWILMAGGVGYVLGALVRYLVPDSATVADALAIPASVGEFWMVGYLLVRGVNRRGRRAAGQSTPVEASLPAHG